MPVRSVVGLVLMMGLGLLATACDSSIMDPLKMPSHKLDLQLHMYCTLHVGAPSALYRFRLDDRYSQIYLRKTIQQTSRTALISAVTNDSTITDTYGSEVFHFRGASVRMPVVWLSDMPSVADGVPSLTYYGIMGMGAASPLWIHWRGYYMDAWTLRLYPFGGGAAPAWNVPLGKPATVSCGASHVCTLTLTPSAEHSEFPKHARFAPDFSFSACDTHVAHAVTMNERRNTNGGYNRAIHYTHSDDDDIRVGFWMLRFFKRHYDMYHLSWSACPSLFYNVTAENDYWWSVVVPLLLILFAGMWVLGVASVGLDSAPRPATLLHTIKLYALLWMVAFVAVMMRCYEGAVMWRRLYDTQNAAPYYVLAATSLLLSVADMVLTTYTLVVLLIGCRVSARTWRNLIMANKVLFEPGVLLVVWMSMFLDAQSWSSMVQALALAFLILVVSAVNMCLCFIYRCVVGWVALPIFLGAAVFAFVTNLRVFMSDYGMPYITSPLNQYLLFAVAVMYVSAYITISFDDSHTKYSIAAIASEVSKKNA